MDEGEAVADSLSTNASAVNLRSQIQGHHGITAQHQQSQHASDSASVGDWLGVASPEAAIFRGFIPGGKDNHDGQRSKSILVPMPGGQMFEADDHFPADPHGQPVEFRVPARLESLAVVRTLV
ncbi:MAG: hypothetical protein JO280_12500, partial [Mycobacteriaceae bacterium]|nr:hypothetical protein [Mycobacteriaceae bacterium]